MDTKGDSDEVSDRNEVVFGQQRKGNPYDKVVKVLSSCEPVKPAKWCASTQSVVFLLKQPKLGIYSREMKIYVHTKTCTHIFITGLFIIAQTGNTINSLTGEWFNGGIHSIKYYSARKPLINAALMALKGIMLS